jgi:hypothetical protein
MYKAVVEGEGKLGVKKRRGEVKKPLHNAERSGVERRASTQPSSLK